MFYAEMASSFHKSSFIPLKSNPERTQVHPEQSSPEPLDLRGVWSEIQATQQPDLSKLVGTGLVAVLAGLTPLIKGKLTPEQFEISMTKAGEISIPQSSKINTQYFREKYATIKTAILTYARSLKNQSTEEISQGRRELSTLHSLILTSLRQ